MSLDISDIDQPVRRDFRRANGAPMYMLDGKSVRGSRPSGFGKVLDDENALTLWKLNRAIQGVAKHPDLIAKAVALKDDDREGWGDLRERAINSGRGDEAADIGTAIHAMSERWEDPGDDFDPGDPYTKHLTAYTDELDRLGLVSERFEYQVVNIDRRAAGTVDRLYRLTKPLVTPDGEILEPDSLIIGDLKTGKKLDYSKPAYAVQMAIYADATPYNVETDEFEAPDLIVQRWGILVHQPSDNPICDALWIDLDVGRKGADIVEAVRAWRSSWRKGDYDCVVIPDPTPSAEAIAEAVGGEVVDQATADREWLELMTPWVQARLNDVRDHAKARQYLMHRWPEGVPTPKQGIIEIEHMRLVLDLLDKTEAEFELAFPTVRPDNAFGHSSEMNRNNQPKEK